MSEGGAGLAAPAGAGAREVQLERLALGPRSVNLRRILFTVPS